jgi:hypothetical protein
MILQGYDSVSHPRTSAALPERSAESGFVTNIRHHGLIADSLAALNAAKTAVASKIPH